MQAVVPWTSSGVAVATDAEVALVSHLLARWASADGEETLLEMLRDCVLERGMAEGDAVEVEGRFNTSTRMVMSFWFARFAGAGRVGSQGRGRRQGHRGHQGRRP